MDVVTEDEAGKKPVTSEAVAPSVGVVPRTAGLSETMSFDVVSTLILSSVTGAAFEADRVVCPLPPMTRLCMIPEDASFCSQSLRVARILE